ncbi:MAG TPA: alpha/beta hydrolase [Pseudonocardiaceae bacterium]|jgi:pimeloyl-ACP methyl ester carboxylesterase|nr:alpha/beta hydrolase [Pseudonocardiaceae bacterium]
MPQVEANGLRLEYDTFGNPNDTPLVLIMGLGAQMISWPVAFCQQYADQGYHVVRFDNRDCGLSTQLDDLPQPDLAAILGGDRSTVPYLMSDFANDTVGLFDALGFARAHVVGASMGGMIAQQLVIDHPDRVASLCSIMSTTGEPTVGQATPEALAMLTRPPAASRDEAIEQGVAALKLISSPDYPTKDEVLRERATAAYDRAHNPIAGLRQTAAIVASPDRTGGLHGVRVPTLVIHGTKDPLVNHSGGEATVAAVPGSTWLSVPGMGHDLPDELWPTYLEAIVANTKG